MSNEEGIGVDVGCGDGDLTAHLSGISGVRMIGVDSSRSSIAAARRRQVDRLHFVNGDVEKNAIASIGVTFDFAVSNCCLVHLSDSGVHELLLDLHSTIKVGGRISILVPCASWARRMYENVEFVENGIVATPRYGGPQVFRLVEWYENALEKCGFENIQCGEIYIPDDPGLEQRYRENVGAPLFDAILAVNSGAAPNGDRNEKAFHVAHQNRNLEIGLFWQRSLFFWGFVAAALVAFGAVVQKSDWLATIFALFGLVCSVIWSAGNRGSKYWQEYWEEKVNLYQHFVTGSIFYDRTPREPKIWRNFSPRRFSVSKLAMALSDFTVVLWLILSISPVFGWFKASGDGSPFWMAVTIVVVLIYCLIVLRHSRSEG